MAPTITVFLSEIQIKRTRMYLIAVLSCSINLDTNPMRKRYYLNLEACIFSISNSCRWPERMGFNFPTFYEILTNDENIINPSLSFTTPSPYSRPKFCKGHKGNDRRSPILICLFQIENKEGLKLYNMELIIICICDENTIRIIPSLRPPPPLSADFGSKQGGGRRLDISEFSFINRILGGPNSQNFRLRRSRCKIRHIFSFFQPPGRNF